MKRIIPLIAMTLLCLNGCGAANEAASADATAATETTAAETMATPIYVMGGRVNSENQADVTTKISGKVAQILVDVGAEVEQGQTLLILDTADLQAQVNQAQAAVSVAQANLNSVTAAARPEQIDQAQAAVDSAQQSYNTAKTNLDRVQQLYDADATSLQALESAQTQLTAAEAQYKSAQDQLTLLQKGATEQAVAVVEQQVKQSQAALATAQTQLKNGTITAPLSGVVTAKKVDVGELASPGTTLLSIVNNDSICVDAFLPADLSANVQVGDAVIVKIAEIPDATFTGQVTVINAEINAQNQDVQVKVSVPNESGALKNGMFAEIALEQ